MLSQKFNHVRVDRKLVMGKNAQIVATSTAGVETVLDMAELAALNDIAASDLAKIDGITNGTGAAGKALVLDASGNVSIPDNGLIGLSRAAVAATGSDAAGAAVLADQVNAVTASDGTKGVALPAAATTTGPIVVINTVATAALKVYPVSGGNDNINAEAEDAAVSVGPGQTAVFIPTSATQWYVSSASLAAATPAEIDRVADVSTRIVNATAATLTVTEAEHDGKTIVLDRAGGIAVTLPVASAGLKFEFIVKTTFTGAATIKSVAGADIMIGHAIMGNNTDNTVVNWQATAADTFDTIDLLGTSNSTGGMAGQRIRISGLAANLWYVEIIGDAAGTEATPFANTVA